MKRLLITVPVLMTAFALVAVAAFAPRPARAQDGMTHVCDSTLITLLFVAESHYGFQSMTLDLSTFEKGQFAPLFDSMMAMMDESMMQATDEAMMTEPEMTAEPIMEATEEAMMEPMVVLAPGHVAGEDPACTALRTELDAFTTALISGAMTMEMQG